MGIITIWSDIIILHLCDLSWKTNLFEFIIDAGKFLLCGIKYFLDLLLWNVFPLSSLTFIVFLEIIIELACQVLICILSEDDLDLTSGELVALFFTLSEKIVYFLISQAESYSQHLMNLMVESLNLLNV